MSFLSVFLKYTAWRMLWQILYQLSHLKSPTHRSPGGTSEQVQKLVYIMFAFIQNSRNANSHVVTEQ